MSDDDDCRLKQREKQGELTASVAVIFAILAIAMMVTFTDWLVPKILGMAVLVLMAWVTVRIVRKPRGRAK